MKLLHSADWHLDSPLPGKDPALRQALLAIPSKVAQAARQEGAQLLLLSGDLFDGPPSRESVLALQEALGSLEIPVCIAPGNHDPFTADSVWNREVWPENVRIFTRQTPESLVFPELNCRVWGAAFLGAEAPSLLEHFRAQGPEAWQIGLFHGDPTQVSSPYNPVTSDQIRRSGLHYLALGHIHKGGSFTLGDTLCAWPGCPMGRGFDETGIKGVLSVTLEPDRGDMRFVPLDGIRFYDETAHPQDLGKLLPALGSADYYRITLVGESEPVDLAALQKEFARFPNLILRDRTVPPLDLWASAGRDTLEGIYFGLLKEALEAADPEESRRILLAAKLSRQILEGQEVTLP